MNRRKLFGLVGAGVLGMFSFPKIKWTWWPSSKTTPKNPIDERIRPLLEASRFAIEAPFLRWEHLTAAKEALLRQSTNSEPRAFIFPKWEKLEHNQIPVQLNRQRDISKFIKEVGSPKQDPANDLD